MNAKGWVQATLNGIHPGRRLMGILYQLQARLLRYSKRGHFMVYNANCSPRDSGAAGIHEGRVIGTHQEGVNALVAKLDRRADLDERME